MDSRITFGTKEELNQKRRAEFIALTEIERLELFFASMNMFNKVNGLNINPTNFVIERKSID